MKAGILYGAKDIQVGQAADPAIGPDDVLLESYAAGICGTDLHIYRGEFEDRVHYPAVQSRQTAFRLHRPVCDSKCELPGGFG